MKPLLLFVLPLSLLIGCGARRDHASGFSWGRAGLAFGDVPVGRLVQVDTAWAVGDQPIELVKVDASCDCTQAVLTMADHEVKPGIVAARSRGTARISIRGKKASPTAGQSVVVLWRFAGDSHTHGSPLPIQGAFSKAFDVDPDLVVRTDLPPGRPCPFEITWTSLRPDTVGAPGKLEPDPGIRVVSLTTSRGKDGMPVVRLQGEILPPPAGRPATTSRIRLSGIEPAPPEVPVHASWMPTVSVNPAGVLELRGSDAQQDEVSGVATLAFTEQLNDPEIQSIKIEPADLRSHIRVERERTAASHHRLTVKGTFPSGMTWAEGSICVEGPPGIEEIRIPWFFLRPQGRSR